MESDDSYGVKMKTFLFLFGLLDLCTGKVLIYNLLNDDRKQFTLSTFGFLKKGTLDVKITGFSFKTHDGKNPKQPMFGFTLDKSKTREVSSYIENMQNKCILNSEDTSDKSVSMIFFTFDHINNSLVVTRKKEDVASLLITDMDRDKFLDENNLYRRDTSKVGKKMNLASLSDSSLVHKVKRAYVPSPSSSTATPEFTHATQELKTGGKAVTKAPTKKPTILLGDNGNTVFRLNETEDGIYTGHFLVAIMTDEEEGLYNLFFHNCQNYGNNPAFVNLSLVITEDNNGNFLSAGDMPEPMLYFSFCLLFFILGCVWLSVLKKSVSDVYKIHFLMLSVVFVKSISSVFHGVNSYFIQVTGHHEETWAILYYIVYLFKGALMFVTILLIGAGWAFIKHMLSHKEKKLFLIVIPLQILGQVAWVIMEESEEGQVAYTTWKEIFILFDLLCCGAILFPVVWTIRDIESESEKKSSDKSSCFCLVSIRHLQEGSRTDGKAAMNLNKLKLFRQFYILIVCFIYFTRIIVYLLKITLPFKLVWLTVLFKELATLIFFIVTGYKFRPSTDNPYLQVPQDSDDEIEMEEVLTQSGVTDTVTKVNQRYEERTESTEPLIKQRESSHEYD